jgi:hypothetical protein
MNHLASARTNQPPPRTRSLAELDVTFVIEQLNGWLAGERSAATRFAKMKSID